MLHEWIMARWGTGLATGLGVVGIVGVVVFNLAGAPIARTDLERPRLPEDDSFTRRLAAVDTALAFEDRAQAIQEWRAAYVLARRIRGWEPMIAVGDTALRMEALIGETKGVRARARQAYLLALFRAREVGAQDGIDRTAAAFAALGDTEVAALVRTIHVKATPQ